MSNCSIWGLLASWGGYLGVTCCLSCERGLLATRPDSTLTRGSGLRREGDAVGVLVGSKEMVYVEV